MPTRAQRLNLLLTARTPQDYGIGFARSPGAAPGTPGGHASSNAAAAAFEANPQQAVAVGCALLRACMAPPDATRAAAAKAAGLPTLVISAGRFPSYNAVGEITARLTGGRHVIVPSDSHFVQLAHFLVRLNGDSGRFI